MIPALSSSRFLPRPRVRPRSRAKHRKPGRFVLVSVASVTGLAAVVLAILASVPGLIT